MRKFLVLAVMLLPMLLFGQAVSRNELRDTNNLIRLQLTANLVTTSNALWMLHTNGINFSSNALRQLIISATGAVTANLTAALVGKQNSWSLNLFSTNAQFLAKDTNTAFRNAAGVIQMSVPFSGTGVTFPQGAGIDTGNPFLIASDATNIANAAQYHKSNVVEISVTAFGASPALANNATAFQAAFNYAMKVGVTGSNFVVEIPSGTFNFTAPILLTNCRSMIIRGAGMNNTILRANYAGPVLRTDGFWYSTVEELQFNAAVGHAGALVEIDGNRAGDSSTFSVQGNTFRNVFVVGNGLVADGLSITPLSGSGGVGSQGSENKFMGVHISGSTNAGLHIYGFNALGNNWYGGNIQNCTKYGILCEFGGINVDGVSMQNAVSGLGTQYGYDIAYLSGGGEPQCSVENIISESLRGVWSESAVRPVLVRNYTLYATAPSWQSSHAYSLSNMVSVAITNSIGSNVYAFRCTVAGTSSNTTPAWTVGAVQDGPVTWVVYQDYAFKGVRELAFSKVPYGRVSADPYGGYIHDNLFSREGAVDMSLFYEQNTTFHPPKVARNKVQYLGAWASDGLTNTVKFNNYETMEINQPLLWPYGTSQTPFPIVGLVRNDGFGGSGEDAVGITRNVLGVMGTLGRPFTNGLGYDMRIQGGLGSSASGGGDIEFYTQVAGGTNSAKRMTILPSGNVGINSAAPSQKLVVGGYILAELGLIGAGGLPIYGDSGSSFGITLTTGGSVGFGTVTVPTNTIDVGGSVGFRGTSIFMPNINTSSNTAPVAALVVNAAGKVQVGALGSGGSGTGYTGSENVITNPVVAAAASENASLTLSNGNGSANNFIYSKIAGLTAFTFGGPSNFWRLESEDGTSSPTFVTFQRDNRSIIFGEPGTGASINVITNRADVYNESNTVTKGSIQADSFRSVGAGNGYIALSNITAGKFWVITSSNVTQHTTNIHVTPWPIGLGWCEKVAGTNSVGIGFEVFWTNGPCASSSDPLVVAVGITNSGTYVAVPANTTTNINWAAGDIFTNTITPGITAVAFLSSNANAIGASKILAIVNQTNDATLNWASIPTLNWYGDAPIVAPSNSTLFIQFNNLDGKTNGFVVAGGRPTSFTYSNSFIVSGQFWTNTTMKRVRLKVAWSLLGNAVSGFPSLCMTNVSSGEYHNPTNGFVLTANDVGRTSFDMSPGDYFIATNKSSGSASATVVSSWLTKE